jgi:Tfp pilus assembly protein PilP
MKRMILSVLLLLSVAGCAAQTEQDKLCKFMRTCDSKEEAE